MSQVPSPIPSISISFSPQQLLPVDAESSLVNNLLDEPDSPRPLHLLPPPVMSTSQVPRPDRHGYLSPLSPPSPNGGKGLERARFDAMLKASKERSAMVGAKKPVDLRKEIALKAQKVKQFERRARFLSKLFAPPSPSAAEMPVTPPDSPAVFHYTLPSPGLESPLELFENIYNDPELYPEATRVELVDFRLPYQKKQAEDARRRHDAAVPISPGNPLPSLNEILQRMSKGPVPNATKRSSLSERGSTTGNRLPSFLRSRPSPQPNPESTSELTPTTTDQATKRSRPALPDLALCIATAPTRLTVRTPTPVAKHAAFPIFPSSPLSRQMVNIQITTTICPPTQSKSSPTEFTEENISQFGSEHSSLPAKANKSSVPVPQPREQATKDMFNKLSRRMPGLPGAAACGIKAQDDATPLLLIPEEKLKRRISAPADMSAAQRGVRHPVLDKPGGF